MQFDVIILPEYANRTYIYDVSELFLLLWLDTAWKFLIHCFNDNVELHRLYIWARQADLISVLNECAP